MIRETVWLDGKIIALNPVVHLKEAA